MYEPQTIDEGQCITNEFIKGLLTNLDHLHTCATQDRERISCKSIGETAIAPLSLSPTEHCFVLQSGALSATSSLLTGIEQKTLMFTFQAVTSIKQLRSGVVTAVQHTGLITCDDKLVHTISPLQMAAGFVTTTFDCEANARIELCVKSLVTDTNYSGSPLIKETQRELLSEGIEQVLTVCGGMLCYGRSDGSALDGYFFPPKLDPQCEFGREGVHLAIQNVAALRTAYRTFNQSRSSNRFEFEDREEHTLDFNADEDYSFMIVGELEFCVRTSTNTVYTLTVAVQPTITCGQNRIDCPERTVRVVGGNGTCFSVPIAVCGDCKKGESLIVTPQDAIGCDNPLGVALPAFTLPYRLVQNYCVYKFSSSGVAFSDGVGQAVGRRVAISTLQSIIDDSDAMQEACLKDQGSPALGRRVEGEVVGAGQVLIQAPDTLSPEVYRRKYQISGSVSPCVLEGLKENALIAGSVEVLCGADVQFVRSVEWSPAVDGLCGPQIPVVAFVDCPSDQPISVRFGSVDYQGVSLSAARAPDLFEYDLAVLKI